VTQRLPRIRRTPIPVDAVIVVRGEELAADDSAI
jgi:hypothetical protein